MQATFHGTIPYCALEPVHVVPTTFRSNLNHSTRASMSRPSLQRVAQCRIMQVAIYLRAVDVMNVSFKSTYDHIWESYINWCLLLNLFLFYSVLSILLPYNKDNCDLNHFPRICFMSVVCKCKSKKKSSSNYYCWYYDHFGVLLMLSAGLSLHLILRHL